MIIIDVVTYPMWSQLVEKKEQFIGGVLKEIDFPFGIDETKIIDIVLSKDELTNCVVFKVIGEDFSCGFNVKYGGVQGSHSYGEGWLVMGTAYGSFGIKEHD